MNTYIVKADLTHECEVREYRVAAKDAFTAALQAGAAAGRESEAGVDTLYLLSVEKVVESREKVWP